MIEESNKYRSYFYRDSGLYISIISCILYLLIFQPWNGDIKVFESRVWIAGISLPIIAFAAAFCYQSRNSSREIANDCENKFLEALLENEILDDIIFLYRWNINIGMLTIFLLVIFNVLIFSAHLSNEILGMLTILPMFSIVWLISEFRYSNKLATKLDEYAIEFRKVQNLKYK